MAATVETQRLISVSLNKIAQSRGQRGGINLHKNLLVATVLHKARTAYMMESYSYQQSLQRQKLIQEQQQQQQTQAEVQTATSASVPVSNKGEEMCQAPCDSNLGQPSATPTAHEESRSASTTGTVPDVVAPEPMAVQEIEEAEVNQDKENSPPASTERLYTSENETILDSKSSNDNLTAAAHLSQEAQLASSENISGKQQNLTSATTTCNVLKRRRDNPSACSQDYECPVSKKARVSYESSYNSVSYNTDCTSDFSDISSDDSDTESDSEIMQTSDSPQITNLVSIFNSGFSGLCAVSRDSDSSGYQSDLDISGSSLSQSSSSSSSVCRVRPESPSPVFSRRMSEPSLMCSSQVGRLEALPSAIVLSA